MSDLSAAVPTTGRTWTPPRVSGPLITFVGRNPDASEVEREARAAIEAGYNRGYSEGLATAAAEVNARLKMLEERISALNSVMRQMAMPLERLDDAATGELSRLAIAVGTQLARRELEVHPAEVMTIIRDCLAELPVSNREVRVHLHPVDAAAVRERIDPLRNEQAWRLIEDPAVGRGGARVVVDSSQIDARLDNRVAVVVQTVLAGARGTVTGDITAAIEAEGHSR